MSKFQRMTMRLRDRIDTGARAPLTPREQNAQYRDRRFDDMVAKVAQQIKNEQTRIEEYK